MAYSCKKIMLTLILVFGGACFWPAQTLMCHICDLDERCTHEGTCEEEESVCVSEIIKMANYTRVRKLCSTSCEDFFHVEVIENKDTSKTSTPDEPIVPHTVSEVSEMTNKKTFLFRQNGPMESTIICCDNDLCNQARARSPEDITFVLGFLLSFMWLIQASML